MKAYELTVKLTADGTLELPEPLLRVLPRNQDIRVIVLAREPEEDEEVSWSRLAAEQFLAGYSPADAIYDRA